MKHIVKICIVTLLCNNAHAMKRKIQIEPALLVVVEQEVSANVNLQREILQDGLGQKGDSQCQYYCNICDSWLSSRKILQRHNRTSQRHQALVLEMSKDPLHSFSDV